MVIVLTKNAPSRLPRTLPQLPASERFVVVLDDSTSPAQRLDVQKIVSHVNAKCALNIAYHGRNEQEMLLKCCGIDLYRHSFLQGLGSYCGYSTGYNRNYGVLLACYFGHRTAVFVDDDICAAQADDHFREVRKVAECARYVTSEISYLSDHSVVGHVYELAGVPLHCYANVSRSPHVYRECSYDGYSSAAFLAFRPNDVRYPFLVDVYNEDWIHLMLELAGHRAAKCGTVMQIADECVQISSDGSMIQHAEAAHCIDGLTAARFKEWRMRVKIQELGEVMAEGVMRASTNPLERESQLCDPGYWPYIIEERRRELDRMLEFDIGDDIIDVRQVRDVALDQLNQLASEHLVGRWNSFYSTHEEWREVLCQVAAKAVKPYDWHLRFPVNSDVRPNLKPNGVIAYADPNR